MAKVMRIDEREEESFNDKLDVLKHITDIHAWLKGQVSKDFVLAKLSDKDIKGTTELIVDAYLSKKLLDILAETSLRRGNINKEEAKRIKDIGLATFNSFIVKVTTNAILKRNVKDNYILKLISGDKNEDEKDEGQDINLLKEMLKGEPKKEEEK